MVFTVIGMAASVVSAVCALACLRRLRKAEARPQEAAAGPEDEGDAALREGILNLLRYAPAGREKEEETGWK